MTTVGAPVPIPACSTSAPITDPVLNQADYTTTDDTLALQSLAKWYVTDHARPQGAPVLYSFGECMN